MKTKDAIAAFGSAKALAEALQITQSAISQWGDDVPLLRAFQIKERCEDLRPDVRWDVLRGTKEAARG